MCGVFGFLLVRRYGLGLAIGGTVVSGWLVLTAATEQTDLPIGPAQTNPGAAGYADGRHARGHPARRHHRRCRPGVLLRPGRHGDGAHRQLTASPVPTADGRNMTVRSCFAHRLREVTPPRSPEVGGEVGPQGAEGDGRRRVPGVGRHRQALRAHPLERARVRDRRRQERRVVAVAATPRTTGASSCAGRASTRTVASAAGRRGGRGRRRAGRACAPTAGSGWSARPARRPPRTRPRSRARCPVGSRGSPRRSRSSGRSSSRRRRSVECLAPSSSRSRLRNEKSAGTRCTPGTSVSRTWRASSPRLVTSRPAPPLNPCWIRKAKVAAPCGSRSHSSTRPPQRAASAERLTAAVVLPTPPLML